MGAVLIATTLPLIIIIWMAMIQGRSQRGVQGVQLKPPSKLMIFMTIVYAYGKIDGRNILEYMLILIIS